MGLKWYHILLFTAVIVIAAYFAIPTNTQMGVLEARSGDFTDSRNYLLSSIRDNHADWEDIDEYIEIAGLLFQHAESVHILTNYLAIHPEDQRAYRTLANSYMLNRQMDKAIAYMENLPDKTRDDFLQLVDLYEKAGRLDDAIALLDSMLTGDSSDYNLLKQKTRYQRWKNRYFDEADSLKKMYAIQPDEQVLDRLLDIYIWQGKLKPAIATALMVLKTKTDDAALLRKARTVFISSGNAPDALELAKRICLLPDATIDDYMVFAQLNDWTDHTKEAIATLEEGLKHYTNNADMMRFLSSLYFKNNELDKSAAMMKQLAIMTDNRQDWYNAAIVARDAGHPKESLTLLKNVGDTKQTLWLKNILVYELGNANMISNTVAELQASGDTNMLAGFVSLVSQVFPGNGTNETVNIPVIIPADPVDMLAAKAREEAQAGNYPEAESLFKEYLEERPEDGWGWYELGEVLFNAGGNGMPEMRKALEYLPINGTAERYALHAGIRDREGRTGEAERLYQDAVSANTNAVDVICDYVDFLITHRKLATANRLITDTRKRFPDYLRLERLYAILLIEKGQYKDALALLRLLYTKHPNDYELEGDLAYAEDVNGHWKRAIKLYRAAAEKSALIPREADRTASFRRRESELRNQYYPQILYTYIQQRSNEEDIYRNVGGGRAFLTEKLCLKLLGEHQEFIYAPPDETQKETSHLTLFEAALEARLTDWIIPRGAIHRYHISDKDYNGWSAALQYAPRPKLSVQAQYVYHYPWLDNIFSLINAGYYNEWGGSLYMREIPRIGFLADYRHRDYTLDVTNEDAGKSDELYARLEYELLFAPDRSYGIGFSSPWIRYDDSMNLALLPYVSYNYKEHNVPDGFDTVPVTQKTSNYRFGIDWYQPITGAWGGHAGAYIGGDPDRDIGFADLYGFRAKIMYILYKRTRVWTMYEVNSENLSGLDDGETHYWYIGANHIF